MKVVQCWIVEVNGVWTTLWNCGDEGWCYDNRVGSVYEPVGVTWIDESKALMMIGETKKKNSIAPYNQNNNG